MKIYDLPKADQAGTGKTIRCSQDELTFDQDKKLIPILGNMSLTSLENGGIKDFLEHLFNSGTFEEFIDVIMSTETGEKFTKAVNIGGLKNSQWIPIVNDFFLLNKPSTSRFVDFFQGADLQEKMITFFLNLKQSLLKRHTENQQTTTKP